MSDEFLKYNKRNVGDRQISELIGLSKAFLADGKIDLSEAECLQSWLVANQEASDHPLIRGFLIRVNEFLEDGILDEEESKELFETLNALVGGKIELGEVNKSTTLPFTSPEPEIVVEGKNFCFTGTFSYGNRKDCQAAVVQRGGLAASLNSKLNYLVIGSYATDSWVQSSWGRKIEKAIHLSQKGANILIVSEAHWSKSLQLL